MKQLISYAIGCMMGRYRLDRPGLHIAHPDCTAADIEPYALPSCLLEGGERHSREGGERHSREGGNSFTIDDDGIIPLMPLDSGFPTAQPHACRNSSNLSLAKSNTPPT